MKAILAGAQIYIENTQTNGNKQENREFMHYSKMHEYLQLQFKSAIIILLMLTTGTTTFVNVQMSPVSH